jgi:uncharacterized glyoxalase superfamily protein PhnB
LVAPVFRVADLGRALAHYRERLGFEIEFVHADFYAGVRRGGCRIHLKHAPPLPRSVDDEHIDICVGVRDLETLAASLAETGADFAVPLRRMPYGSEFYLRDVDGHVLGFVEAA